MTDNQLQCVECGINFNASNIAEFYVICSPVVRGGWVTVELELSRHVEGAVQQLVRRVRAETEKLFCIIAANLI